MDQTDNKVSRSLSGLDPGSEGDLQARIEELLGLRAHLQDELLRIQAMFADFDPELMVQIKQFFIQIF